jgi:hypothetical protein
LREAALSEKRRITARFKCRAAWYTATILAFAVSLHAPLARAASPQSDSKNAATGPAGQHDFDFLIGTWKTHISRLQHPLTGSSSWIQMEGTVAVRKIWNGRADLGEVEADGSTGHFEALTLRLYSPQTRQWNLYFADSKEGVLAQPMTGDFHNGRGEFYDQELFNGRAIYVRNVYSDITSNSFRFEQAFSADGTKTWETNWIATFTRENSAATEIAAPPLSADAPQHEFDFELGSWKLHLKRLLNPLTGSHTWTEFDADSVTRTIWGGRGQLEQFEASGSGGRIEGLTLRTYNPQTHQWSLYWANGKDGTLFVPQIGEFNADTGEFYGTYTVDGKYVYVRFIWWPKTAHFEQAFSADGGETWEVNWITDQTRVKVNN